MENRYKNKENELKKILEKLKLISDNRTKTIKKSFLKNKIDKTNPRYEFILNLQNGRLKGINKILKENIVFLSNQDENYIDGMIYSSGEKNKEDEEGYNEGIQESYNLLYKLCHGDEEDVFQYIKDYEYYENNNEVGLS